MGGLKDSEHLATLRSSAVHHVTQLELAKRQTTLGGPSQHTHPVIQNYSDWCSQEMDITWVARRQRGQHTPGYIRPTTQIP